MLSLNVIFRTITNYIIMSLPTWPAKRRVGPGVMDTDKDAPRFKEVKNRKRKKDKDMDTGDDDVTLMETAAKRPSFPPVDDTTALVINSYTHAMVPLYVLVHCRAVRESSGVFQYLHIDSHL